MDYTSNDAVVYDARQGIRLRRDDMTVLKLTTVLYSFPLDVTFHENCWPEFSLRHPTALDLNPNHRLVKRTLYLMSVSAADWMRNNRLMFQNAEAGTSTINKHWGSLEKYLEFEVENRIQLAGERSYMTVLMRGLLRDGIAGRIPKDLTWPEDFRERLWW